MYRKLFVKSWQELRTNLSLAVPDILAVSFALLLASILLYTSGAFAFAAVLNSLQEPNQARTFVIETMQENLGTIIRYATTWFILAFLATTAARAVKFGMMKDIILKKKATLRRSGHYLQSYFWRLVGLSIIITLVFALLFSISLIIVGTLANSGAADWLVGLVAIICILVAIWIYMALFLSKAILVLENKGVAESLKQSNKVFKKRKIVVVKLLLVIIATILITNIAAGIFGIIPIVGNIVSTVIFIAVALWTGLFIFNVYTLRQKC